MKIVSSAIIAVLIFSGCSEKNIHITIDSFPKGAQIIDLKKNKSRGITPLDGYAQFRKIFGTDEPVSCITEPGFKLIWPSGATAQIETIRFCPEDINKVFNINRPADAPNLEYDLKYAETLNEEQKIKLMKAQADATESAATAQVWNNLNQQLQNQQRNSELQQQSFELQRINNYMRYKY